MDRPRRRIAIVTANLLEATGISLLAVHSIGQGVVAINGCGRVLGRTANIIFTVASPTGAKELVILPHSSEGGGWGTDANAKQAVGGAGR